MRVLVAMSGGVDSSLAAALLVEAGHDVAGATLKLWDGPSDSGCCSVADVEDARWVADRIGIAHHVFNMADAFGESVVSPYVTAHASGRTPNPCIECNRHIKFDRLLGRASRLGYDALATGHHARVGATGGRYWLRRGVDGPKDQSYVLSMLGQEQLACVLMPIGEMTKAEVRERASALALRTAAKPDSQDVCFIHGNQGRHGFLADRVPLHAGELVDEETRALVGRVDAVELVTVGQRRGMGHGTDGRRRYVVAVDVERRQVTVGGSDAVLTGDVLLEAGSVTWVDRPLRFGARAIAQLSAHGRPVGCTIAPAGVGARDATVGTPAQIKVRFDEPQRLVAPGQTVALYEYSRPESVVGAGIAARDR